MDFSCSMGMYRGKFVINASGSPSDKTSGYGTAPQASAKSSFGRGGCSMMGGGAAKIAANGGSAVDAANQETVQATYTRANGMVPNDIKVKSGKTYTVAIDAKDTISGCMGSIAIP